MRMTGKCCNVCWSLGESGRCHSCVHTSIALHQHLQALQLKIHHKSQVISIIIKQHTYVLPIRAWITNCRGSSRLTCWIVIHLYGSHYWLLYHYMMAGILEFPNEVPLLLLPESNPESFLALSNILFLSKLASRWHLGRFIIFEITPRDFRYYATFFFFFPKQCYCIYLKSKWMNILYNRIQRIKNYSQLLFHMEPFYWLIYIFIYLFFFHWLWGTYRARVLPAKITARTPAVRNNSEWQWLPGVV